jgi:tetratricopeptide (TPR) repeat protein
MSMHCKSVITVVFGLTLALATVSAFGQNQDQNRGEEAATCAAAAQTIDTGIEACTRLLEAGARSQALTLTLRAAGWMAKGDRESAFKDLTQAIGLAPDLAAAYAARGDFLRGNNQCDLAAADYNHAITLQPDEAVPYIGRAMCLIDAKEPERARADLDRTIKLDGDKPDGLSSLAWSIKGQIESDKGDLDPAVTDYGEAIRLAPQDAGLYIDRGTVWARKGDNDKAAADLEQAIKLDEKNAGGYAVAALSLKARLDFSKGNPERAIVDYDEAIRLAPQQAALYLGRAVLRNSMGDFEHAVADYDQAIKVDPKSTLAYNARGDFLRNRGEYDKAVADYDKAIENQPDDLAAYGNRALARFYTGDFAEAIDDFKRVTDAQANAYPMLLLYLSRAHANHKDATPELAKSIGKLKAADWPYPVAEFYLGRKSIDAVLAAAQTPGQRCEAQFYIGEWQLTHDAEKIAAKALQTAVDTCPKDFVEYAGAVAELKRLK